MTIWHKVDEFRERKRFAFFPFRHVRVIQQKYTGTQHIPDQGPCDVYRWVTISKTYDTKDWF